MADALKYALINRHLDTCRLLIEAGADPDIEPDIRGYVSLNMTTGLNLLTPSQVTKGIRLGSYNGKEYEDFGHRRT